MTEQELRNGFLKALRKEFMREAQKEIKPFLEDVFDRAVLASGIHHLPISGVVQSCTRKISYADHVTMTKAEFGKLLDNYGFEKTHIFIDKLNTYKGSKGKRYKSDYLAILNWVVPHFEGKKKKEVVYD